MKSFRSIFRRMARMNDHVQKAEAAISKGTVLSVHTFRSGLRDAELYAGGRRRYAYVPHGYGSLAVGDTVRFTVNTAGDGCLVA